MKPARVQLSVDALHVTIKNNGYWSLPDETEHVFIFQTRIWRQFSSFPSSLDLVIVLLFLSYRGKLKKQKTI